MLEKVTKKPIGKIISQSKKENTIFLFWDTCSLLDIIRLPFRTNSDNNLKLYQKINELIKADKVVSVGSALTIAELSYNFPRVEQEYDNYLKKLQRDFDLHEKYLIRCNSIENPMLTFQLTEKGLKQQLIKLFIDIISKTTFVSEKQDFNKFAHFRVSYHMAPAQRKGEYKDCYIWATCLELAQELKATNNEVIFFTRNKDDFYDNGDLFGQIKNDCSKAKIKVKCEIGELYGEMNN